MSQFVFGLYEFADYFRCYLSFIGTLTNLELKEFLFSTDDNIIYYVKGLIDSYSFSGLGNTISFILEEAGPIGTIFSWIKDLIFGIVSGLYDVIFTPVFIPFGYTANDIPFIFCLVTGVFNVAWISSLVKILFKLLADLLKVFIRS